MSAKAWVWKRCSAGHNRWYEYGPYTIMHFPQRHLWKLYIDGEMVRTFDTLRAAKQWAQWRMS